VLISDRHSDPIDIVKNALMGKNVAGSVQIATPTLEDVFVAVTMKPEESGQ
jgi:hypothetical protein